jgi:hypothetical protein
MWSEVAVIGIALTACTAGTTSGREALSAWRRAGLGMRNGDRDFDARTHAKVRRD